MKTATAQIGDGYAGRGPDGFDCSGLTAFAFADAASDAAHPRPGRDGPAVDRKDIRARRPVLFSTAGLVRHMRHRDQRDTAVSATNSARSIRRPTRCSSRHYVEARRFVDRWLAGVAPSPSTLPLSSWCRPAAVRARQPVVLGLDDGRAVPGNLPSEVTHRLTLTGPGRRRSRFASRPSAPWRLRQRLHRRRADGRRLSRVPVRGALDPPARGERSAGTQVPAPDARAVRHREHRHDGLVQKPPWASDDLDAAWDITPAQGTEFNVVSTAPTFQGAYGVELDFDMTRVGQGIYAVIGTAEDADSGGWSCGATRRANPREPSGGRAGSRRRGFRGCACRGPAGGSSTPATGPPSRRTSPMTPRSAARSWASASATRTAPVRSPRTSGTPPRSRTGGTACRSRR